jgi:hypothetical protein
VSTATGARAWAPLVSERLGFAPAPATGMVALRVGLYGAIAIWALTLSPTEVAETAALHWEPRSVLRLLPAPPPTAGVVAAWAATIVLACAAALGWRGPLTRAALVPPLVLVAGLGDASFGSLSHRTALTVVLALVLAPAPLAAHWSLDARRRRRAGEPAPAWRTAAWAWPVAVARIVVVLVYLSAGVAKLRFGGVGWLRPESFQRWTYSRLDRMEEPSQLGLWIAENPALAAAAAAGILVLQLSVVSVLVWPRLGPWVAGGIVAFHVGSWLALGLQFLLQAAVAPLPLLPWERWRGRLGRPRPPVGPVPPG